jgi:hypothetical protein
MSDLSLAEGIIIIVFWMIGWISANGENEAQYVRLIDVFIYGPFLIILGLGFDKQPIIKYGLLWIGVTTISYNLKNYMAINSGAVDKMLN